MEEPITAPIVGPITDPPVEDPPAPPGERDWIPEEYRAEKCLESIPNLPTAFKTLVSGQKMIGGMVKIPKEDAPPEERDAFYTKLGRPEKAEGYGLAKPDTLPEGVSWDQAMVDWFGKSAHAAGLSKGQATALMQSYNEQQFSKAHAGQKEMKTALDGLRDSWGSKFDGNVELGVRGIERLLPADEAKEFKSLMDATGIGNHPLMLKFAHKVGNMLKEDGYIIGDGKGGVHGSESAKAKIASINADKAHAHWNENAPGHKEAVEDMAKLFRVAYPPSE